ncbi:hypothetical protein RUM43_012259 [Polyplax serrata]|uniref:Low-density lipoprotein receptor-related protein 4 n=1 Tax=Polyplax serrata TaxID=468196 RepID=A0AAN8PD82_POLSC
MARDTSLRDAEVCCTKVQNSEGTASLDSNGNFTLPFANAKNQSKPDKSGTSNSRGVSKKVYGGNLSKKQTDYSRSHINPQNVRHPELPNSNFDSSGKPKPGRHHKHHLLPNMYQPMPVPMPIPISHHYNGDFYPANSFYSPIPYPNHHYNVGSGNGFGYPAEDFVRKSTSTNGLNPSYRSGVVRGGGYINGQMNYPFMNSPEVSRNSEVLSRAGYNGGIRQEEMSGRLSKLKEEDDEDEIIAGKFSPCGGECDQDEFLCVGSCTCIPNTFRCDGDPDCTGEQDELECGETELDIFQSCLETENYVRCPRSGKCIKKTWLCDGDDDCGDFSDETHCDGRNCTAGEFECNNGFCVQKSWVCDGDNDCKDYSDETNCTKKNACSVNEFHCTDGNCVSLSWKCDLEPDCSDGSDEADCSQEPHVCNDNEFECAYPRCVKKDFKCDGDNDCGDWSDEQNCPNTESSCGPSEFKCNGGRCIPELWKCDEETDCENGEDETECTEKLPKTCGPDEFSCNNGNCILKTWLCDNVQDCSKGEDEENCEQTCHETQFNCAAHRKNDSSVSLVRKSPKPLINCIGRKHVCDGKKDCPRGEDERNCPKKKKCESDTKCQQLCVVLSNGRDACSCETGFMLSSDNHTCNDIDECQFEYDPVCSQICNNTIGSFTCLCKSGYVSLNNLRYTAILKGLQNAIAIDYHYNKGWIYWSDVSMDVIKRAKVNGTEKSGAKIKFIVHLLKQNKILTISALPDVIKWGLESPGGVAIDWIHNLLYWTDSGTRRVEVATLDGKYRSVIVSNDLDKPRAIVVHPGLTLVFWTDWGPKPKIEVSEMDGRNRQSIITEGVFWPNGLALDYAIDRLYWTDAKHHAIESAKLDGSDRRKIVTKGLPHPFAITLFEEAIYWTDWHTKSIASANKDTGMGYKIVHAGLHFPMDIHSFHSQRQPMFPNHCGDNSGGCSHLCLPNKISYRCACPLGLHLHKDKKTCTDTPEKLLIFARNKDIRLRQLGQGKEVGIIDMVIPLDQVRSAVALAFDSDGNMIYWSDVESHRISRSFLNGSNQEVIISSNLASPSGLAVDWVTKKIYWTDAGTNRIELSNMNGSMRALLIWDGLDKPRDISVDPIGGYMYWSDWGKSPKIERAGMNGSNRKILFSENLIWPNGLAIDQEKNRLYWVDGGTKAIEYSRLDGTGRTALKISGTEVRHPFGLALFGKSIYWTDWETNSIHTADKITGKNGAVLRDRISNLMDVRVFHREYQRIHSPCLVNNGGCSHLCLIAPPPEKYSCECPIGIKLLRNGKTCAPGPTNSLIFAHRVDIREISLDVPYTVDTVLPLPPMKNTKGVDVDRKTGDIYWTDTTEDVIMRASRDGYRIESVVIDNLDTADGIVVDSTGRKIYWTDAGRKSIEVCELDGTNRKVLIWTDLENPRAITLHYHHGLMFWSDWGKKARIEQADMDGKNRKILISNDLDWPNGLAIDRPGGRLYWNDGKRKTIESSDLQGRERRIIVQKVPHPYGLVIVGTHMYWTDWKTQSVHRADKRNGSDSQIIRKGLEGLMDIRSVQAENIAENACGEDNGGCSHLCLRKPEGYSCNCPTGIILGDDQKTCNPLPSIYLLFATRSKLVRVSLDTAELWDVTLPITEIENSIAVDFHWNKQMIYYSDVNLDVIRGVNMKNLSENRLIISENLTTPDGLAIDWLAENLFWTDTGRKVLEVAKIDGTSRKVIFDKGLDEPRAVAVFPGKGYLYWTDWGDSPKIERSLMDGSQRRVVVGADLGFPNGLALDYDAKKLYWADALKDRIEVSDLHGRNRVQLVLAATHPFGLTIFEEHIYWTDWYSKSVERADKTTGRDRISIKSELDSVMEIKAVSGKRQTGWSPCQEKNGYCSHLCLFRRKDYICACPDKPDHRPCETEPTTRVPIPISDVDDEDLIIQSVDGGTKSDLDKIHGDPSIDTSDDSPPGDSFSKQLMLISIIIILCVLIIIPISSSIVLLFHRRRKKQKKYMFADAKNVLTFSNPNYTASGSGGEPGTSTDKKPFLWKKLKYDKSQERVFDVQEERPDGVGFSDERPSSTPAVPERLDSVNPIQH